MHTDEPRERMVADLEAANLSESWVTPIVKAQQEVYRVRRHNNLGETECAILRTVYLHQISGKLISLADIAHAVDVNRQTVSRRVLELERRGLLCREPQGKATYVRCADGCAAIMRNVLHQEARIICRAYLNLGTS